MVTKNSTTITLTGTEQTVQFDRAYPYFWVHNLGDSDVFISMDGGIVEGADGVITVPAGGSCGTMHGYPADKLYLLGGGKVQVMGTGSAFNPFKAVRKGGENLDIPHQNGIIHEYDYRNINNINPKEWVDYMGNMNFVLNNAVLNTEEGCLEFHGSQNAYGVLAENEPIEWTAYFLYRCTNGTVYEGGYSYICLSASYGNNSYQKAEFAVNRESNFPYAFIGYDGNISSKASANVNFCVVAVTRTASSATLYINGIKIDSVQSSSYRADKWMIFDRKNNGASVGTSLHTNGILQVKYLAIANIIHTDQQICENSKFILAKYLK